MSFALNPEEQVGAIFLVHNCIGTTHQEPGQSQAEDTTIILGTFSYFPPSLSFSLLVLTSSREVLAFGEETQAQ